MICVYDLFTSTERGQMQSRKFHFFDISQNLTEGTLTFSVAVGNAIKAVIQSLRDVSSNVASKRFSWPSIFWFPDSSFPFWVLNNLAFGLPCITWFFFNTSLLVLRFASKMAWLGFIFLFAFFLTPMLRRNKMVSLGIRTLFSRVAPD